MVDPKGMLDSTRMKCIETEFFFLSSVEMKEQSFIHFFHYVNCGIHSVESANTFPGLFVHSEAFMGKISGLFKHNYNFVLLFIYF